jgi:hypothetical protein
VVVVVLGSVPQELDVVFVGGTGAPHRHVTVEVHPQEQQDKPADREQDPQEDLGTLLL